ncbi:hypothetical protein [Azospirillum halopraeferens]|uniref:hypothetical protein n=1 Tax=Azospirillum halopraeferens TaxID=34010 RepID=UPI000408E232|nr:hypothetical protein [Azospirillum halopraeferens]
MIAQLFESDHLAGQEVFSVVGNATQPAWDERAGEMSGLAELWRAHGAMLDRVVVPALHRCGVAAADLEEVGALQRRVAELAGDLAARAGRGGDAGWITDFERLKSLFDAQCLHESSGLMTLIAGRLPPDAIAEATRAARALRGLAPRADAAGVGVGAGEAGQHRS